MARDVAAPVTSRRFGSSSRKAVMMVLAEWCDVDWSTVCGQPRIAAESELSIRTVRDVLKELEAEGLISREKRYRENGYRTSDRTRLNKEKILALPAAFAGSDPEAPTVDEKANGHKRFSAVPDLVEHLPAAAAASGGATGNPLQSHRQPSPFSPAAAAGYPGEDPGEDPRALPATAAGRADEDAEVLARAWEKAKAQGGAGALAQHIYNKDYHRIVEELREERAVALEQELIGACDRCDTRGMYEATEGTLYRCTHPDLEEARVS